MTYADALHFYGTQVRLAAALGITQPTVSSWHGVIPPRYQFQLQVITGGKLRADDVLIPSRLLRRRATDQKVA